MNYTIEHFHAVCAGEPAEHFFLKFLYDNNITINQIVNVSFYPGTWGVSIALLYVK